MKRQYFANGNVESNRERVMMVWTLLYIADVWFATSYDYTDALAINIAYESGMFFGFFCFAWLLITLRPKWLGLK